MTSIAIVGGGIAGLALAEQLTRRRRSDDRLEVLVLEKGPRAGGNIRTEIADGFLCESGPDGFLDSVPETLELVRRIGLDEHLQRSRGEARRRFVFRNGRLHALPGAPLEFVRSRLLSWPGKLRIMLEPFARRRPPDDETIHAFATRRIGREAADVLIDSMVSGIFAGDARELSLHACFPKMWHLEEDYGGLFRAVFRIQWQKYRQARRAGMRRTSGDALGAAAGKLTSFRWGMQELVDGLLVALSDRVRLNQPVEAVDVVPDGPTGARRLVVSIAGAGRLRADAVVLAGPAAESASIVEPLDPVLAGELRGIPTAPLVVVCLGYDEAAVTAQRGPLDGFGYLVPRGEGSRMLGALWESTIYPGRAPAGGVLLRVMIGGSRDPEAVALPDAELLAIVRRDLRVTMGLNLAPTFVRIIRHRRGIPQYRAGHLARLDRIEARLEQHPGLFVAGNSYRGVSVNACIADAGPLADRILGHLRSGAASREPARRAAGVSN